MIEIFCFLRMGGARDRITVVPVLEVAAADEEGAQYDAEEVAEDLAEAGSEMEEPRLAAWAARFASTAALQAELQVCRGDAEMQQRARRRADRLLRAAQAMGAR